MAIHGRRHLTGDIGAVAVDQFGRLIIITGAGVILNVDVIDRAARLVGIVYGENAPLQQLTPADGVTPNESLEAISFGMVYDDVAGDWNRVREGNVLGSALVDVSDDWTRLLGQLDLARYGGAAVGPANPVDVQDTGLNTNPERWMHDNHWDCDEVTIAAIGVGGEQNLGAVVGAGVTRRIRELLIRHAGTNPTVVTLLVSGGATKFTIDVPAGTTRVWSAPDGREFVATEQPAVQGSDVAGGNTYVSASGVEA